MRALFRKTIGSARFGTAVMTLLVVSLGYATVTEATRGTESAWDHFYRSRWFAFLMLLLGVNVLSALAVRFPFTRRQMGFAINHIGILVVLAGALMTRMFGVDGQVALVEGETSNVFYVPEDRLAIMDNQSGRQVSSAPTEGRKLNLDGVRVRVEQFISNCRVVQKITDDASTSNPAIQVSFSLPEENRTVWVFAKDDAQSEMIRYRIAPDAATLDRWLKPPAATRPAPKGIIEVGQKEKTIEFKVEDGLGKDIKFGETGLTLRIVRYFSHAVVGEDHQIQNASDRPVNPAVEVEISGSAGKAKRLVFARFPDFSSSHGTTELYPELKIRMDAGELEEPAAPIEVLGGPEGKLFVRFRSNGKDVQTHPIRVGVGVASPWEGRKFTVLRRIEHARVHEELEPAADTGSKRTPGLKLSLWTGTGEKQTAWLQKYASTSFSHAGRTYELSFGDRPMDLGFDLKLDRFVIGYYPGGTQPQSYESHVTISDGPGQPPYRQTIWMNHPISHGGYSLYQSSYQESEGRRQSVLSVSRDPGKPVVFTGYLLVAAGMLVMLWQRGRT